MQLSFQSSRTSEPTVTELWPKPGTREFPTPCASWPEGFEARCIRWPVGDGTVISLRAQDSELSLEERPQENPSSQGPVIKPAESAQGSAETEADRLDFLVSIFEFRSTAGGGDKRLAQLGQGLNCTSPATEQIDDKNH